MAIIYWATLRINIEQTLEWITGLPLELIWIREGASFSRPYPVPGKGAEE